jgi:hypothetical protein
VTESCAYLVDQNLVVDEEHFHSENTSTPETTDYVTSYLLGLLLNVLGYVTRWKENLRKREI